jgi:RND family efflux transporter MFP subunit
VAAGASLLQIDPLKQEATVNSQEATRLAQESNVNLARVNLERAKKLAEAGVIAKSDLDNAQTNYDTAVAQLKSLEHQVEQQKVELRYYKVSSPMDGIVGDIPVRVGDRVIVSTLLTTVDEPGALEAYLYIPAARSKDLRLGLPMKREICGQRHRSRLFLLRWTRTRRPCWRRQRCRIRKRICESRSRCVRRWYGEMPLDPWCPCSA